MNTARETVDAAEVSQLLESIAARTGTRLGDDRRPHALDVVRRAVVESGLDVAAFARRLDRDRDTFDALVAELTVGETYFFRDAGQFAFIAGPFIEEMERERPADHRIRVWSAGCASGEEVWSLAILFAERGLAERTRIVGTDLSVRALDRARAGRYRPWSLRDGGVERAGEWVRERDDLYEISDRLRGMARFQPLNLADATFPESFTGFDLILCRNVLLYLDDATIRGVARRFHAALAPGGWLMMGAADPPVAEYAPFERVQNEYGILLRRPDPGSRRDRRESLPTRAPQPSAAPRRKERPVTPRSEHPVPVEPVPSDPAPRGAVDDDPRATFERIRTVANDDPERARTLVGEAVSRFEVAPELHYLEGLVLAELDRPEEAIAAVRKALFLDRGLVVGHLLLAALRDNTGEAEASRRAYANAARLCRELPPEAIVPLSDGECAGRLAELAERGAGRRS